jgi:hypothetical protein
LYNPLLRLSEAVGGVVSGTVKVLVLVDASYLLSAAKLADMVYFPWFCVTVYGNVAFPFASVVTGEPVTGVPSILNCMLFPAIALLLLSVNVAIKLTRVLVGPFTAATIKFVGVSPTVRVLAIVFCGASYVSSAADFATILCDPMASVIVCDNVAVPVESVVALPTDKVSTKNCTVFPETPLPLLSVNVATKFTRVSFNPDAFCSAMYVGVKTTFNRVLGSVFCDAAYLVSITNFATKSCVPILCVMVYGNVAIPFAFVTPSPI